MSRKNRHQHYQISKKKFLPILNKLTPKKLEFNPEVQARYENTNHAKRGERDGKAWAQKASPEQLAGAAEFFNLDIDDLYMVTALFLNELFGEEIRQSFGTGVAAFMDDDDGDIVPTAAAKVYAYGWTIAVRNTHSEALAKVTSSER